MKTSNLYPIADIRHLPEPRQHRSMRGLLTGEYREPQKGEWYLSGINSRVLLHEELSLLHEISYL